MSKESGIYIIMNLETGRHYVGSASSLKERFKSHRWHLRAGRHVNSKLQRAWNKYGETAFRFDIVERVDDVTLLAEREQYWMDQTLPLYNILRTARSNRGYRMSEDSLKKMSESQKRRYAAMSEEEKLRRATNHAAAMTGRVQSEETRERRRKALIGREFSKESIAKMSQSARNRSEEHLKKIGMARAKEYIVTSPSGDESIIKNLSEFCRQNELSQAHMSGVARGKRRHHKRWLCRLHDSPEPLTRQS